MGRRKRKSTRAEYNTTQKLYGNSNDPVSTGGVFTTKCVPVNKKTGEYGCRVMFNGKVISEQRAKSKREVGATLRDMLRMIDKTGWDSKMAYASRHRRKNS